MFRLDPRTREMVIADLREGLKSTRRGFTDFHECRLTDNITKIVDEITNSTKVDRGLVLLGLLAAAAGLDQGVHQVVNKQNGQVNKLSILILGAGEAGAGKSTALEPFLNIIHEIQPPTHECNQDRIRAMEQRIKRLYKEYERSGNKEIFTEIDSERNKINAIQNIPQLLISDTSKPAFVELMSKQGFVFRMEPDGIPFDSHLHRLITKSWSNESHSEARISRAGNKYDHSVIIDLVYTQPIYFHEFIHNKNIELSGYLPRTLCYFTNMRGDKNDLTPQKPIDEDCLKFTKKILEDIYTTAINSQSNINIVFDNESSILINNYKKQLDEMSEDAKYEEIKSWILRAAQHAVRIAGIIQILECPQTTSPVIKSEHMSAAIEIVKILMQNLYECVHGFTDDKLREITCKIGLIILQKNLQEFNETDFKQTIKSKYNAKEVDFALHELEYREIITRDEDRNTQEKRRGRPSGSIFINRFYTRLTNFKLELPDDFFAS